MGNLFRNTRVNEIAKRQLRPELQTTTAVSNVTNNLQASIVREILFAKTYTETNTTTSGLSTISGYTLVENDAIILNGQTSATDNGVYLASSGTWTKISNLNKYYRFVIEEGVFEAYEFRLNNRPITDTDDVEFIVSYNPNKAPTLKSTKLVEDQDLFNLGTQAVTLVTANSDEIIIPQRIVIESVSWTSSTGSNKDVQFGIKLANNSIVNASDVLDSSDWNATPPDHIYLSLGTTPTGVNEIQADIAGNSIVIFTTNGSYDFAPNGDWRVTTYYKVHKL